MENEMVTDKTTVRALQYVDYDSRSGIINPIGRVYTGRDVNSFLADRDPYGYIEGPYHVVAHDLQGWGRFNRLVQLAGGGWALIEEQ